MHMRLELNGIDVECVIGERADERVRTQPLRIDVSLTVDDRAAETDDLADTVDYAALAAKIRRALVAAECRMIERAAKVVCYVCRAERGVRAVTAKVTKSGAVAHLGSASATFGVTL